MQTYLQVMGVKIIENKFVGPQGIFIRYCRLGCFTNRLLKKDLSPGQNSPYLVFLSKNPSKTLMFLVLGLESPRCLTF